MPLVNGHPAIFGPNTGDQFKGQAKSNYKYKKLLMGRVITQLSGFIPTLEFTVCGSGILPRSAFHKQRIIRGRMPLPHGTRKLSFRLRRIQERLYKRLQWTALPQQMPLQSPGCRRKAYFHNTENSIYENSIRNAMLPDHGGNGNAR
jgi:hypothetical protein